jgi:hypothetical protein
LKVEWLHDHDLRDRETVRTDFFRSIEGDYNRCCRHSSIGYRNPADYELHMESAA